MKIYAQDLENRDIAFTENVKAKLTEAYKVLKILGHPNVSRTGAIRVGEAMALIASVLEDLASFR